MTKEIVTPPPAHRPNSRRKKRILSTVSIGNGAENGDDNSAFHDSERVKSTSSFQGFASVAKEYSKDLSRETKTYTNPLTGEKAEVTVKSVTLKASKLRERTLVASTNVRRWLSDEYRDHPSYESIVKSGIETQTMGYTLPGKETIYIADGGSRRLIALDILNNSGVDLDYPILVHTLTETQMWIAKILLNHSDAGKSFQLIENAERLLEHFSDLAQITPPSMRSLIESFKSSTGFTFSVGRARSFLVYSAINRLLPSDFFAPFLRQENISEKSMQFITKYCLKTDMANLELSEPDPLSNQTRIRLDLINYIQENVDPSKVSELSEKLKNGSYQKPKKDIQNMLGELVMPTNQMQTSKSQTARPTGNAIEINDLECGIKISYSREDYDANTMQAIRQALSKFEEEAQALKKKIDLEIEEVMKANKKNH